MISQLLIILLIYLKKCIKKKNKINRDTLNYFIKSINYALINLLDKDDLSFFINKLKEIFLENKIEKINNFDCSEKSKNLIFRDNKSYIEDIERKSIKSSIFSNYSKNSQSQIIKLESEIKDLRTVIGSIILPEDKKELVKLTFLDENIKEEFPINVCVSETDKFSFIIDAFFEKYPGFEEKGIKRFSVNGQKIRRSELFKNIGLDRSSKILIEY